MGVVRKKLNLIVCIMIITSIILSGCEISTSKTALKKGMDNDDEPIKIWYYDGFESNKYTIEMIKKYCKEQGMNVEWTTYGEDELSVQDYFFKRNLAIESGDLDLCLDWIKSYERIKSHAGNYKDNMKNYNNIVTSLKGYHCIPLFMNCSYTPIDVEILNHYKVEYTEPIDINEYYRIKYELKEKGARFKLTRAELYEIEQYHLRQEGILFNDDKVITDEELMNVISNIYMDIKDNYDHEDISLYEPDNPDYIVDSNLIGKKYSTENIKDLINQIKHSGKYVWGIDMDLYSAEDTKISAMFIPKDAKDDVYRIADYIISDEYQIKKYNSNSSLGLSIIDTPKYREYIGLDSEYNYVGKTKIMGYPKQIFEGNYKAYIEHNYYKLFNHKYEYDTLKFVDETIEEFLDKGINEARLESKVKEFNKRMDMYLNK